MPDDPLLWLLRRLPAHARREVALRWCDDMVATLPPTDPRTGSLRTLVATAWTAPDDTWHLHQCWCKAGALRTTPETFLWCWARQAIRQACDSQAFFTAPTAVHVALACRQVAAQLAPPDDPDAQYAAMRLVDAAHRRLVQDLILARSAA